MSAATPITESMQAYYAARAPEYDRVYSKPERQADLQQLRTWLPSHFAGAQVLEIAVGTGYWTQFIAPVAARLVAIDTAPETLAIARQRPGNAGVQFVQADAYALPPALGNFDAAFAGFWYSHVPRRRQRSFLQGLDRVLQAGSTVLLLDNRNVPGSSQPIGAPDADGDTYQTRRLDDGSTHQVLKNYPTEVELQSSTAGLASASALALWEHYWVYRYVTTGATHPRTLATTHSA